MEHIVVNCADGTTQTVALTPDEEAAHRRAQDEARQRGDQERAAEDGQRATRAADREAVLGALLALGQPAAAAALHRLLGDGDGDGDGEGNGEGAGAVPLA